MDNGLIKKNSAGPAFSISFPLSLFDAGGFSTASRQRIDRLTASHARHSGSKLGKMMREIGLTHLLLFVFRKQV